MMGPRALFLIGLPASGKSTFRNSLLNNVRPANLLSEYAVISSDDVLEDVARESQTTYDDVFFDHVENATAVAGANLRHAINAGKWIIIDRTNMSKKSRAQYLKICKKAGYLCDAIVFERPMTDAAHVEWNRRLDRPGKTIPNDILQTMFCAYARPTQDEGFDSIAFTNTFADFV